LPLIFKAYLTACADSGFGNHLAEKSAKKWKKGVKGMGLTDKDVVLTTGEAIEYLKISKPTYLKYVRLGRIKAVKAGNGWRVHQSELYRFLRVTERE
jgi:excisionase family DNA binding protein